MNRVGDVRLRVAVVVTGKATRIRVGGDRRDHGTDQRESSEHDNTEKHEQRLGHAVDAIHDRAPPPGFEKDSRNTRPIASKLNGP